MCILTYRRHWRMRVVFSTGIQSWLSLIRGLRLRQNAGAPHWKRPTRRMRLTDAELAANGVVQWLRGRAQRSTIVTYGKKQTIAWYVCTPPANLETFCAKINALSASGKELAGLKKRWRIWWWLHENRQIAYERILAWTTEGAYEVLGDMYR